MIFHEKDLDMHGDMKVSFLKILPNKIEQFISRMTEKVSHSLLEGKHICKLTGGAGTASGTCVVDHPERLTIGEKVLINDSGTATATAVYVTEINMNTKQIKLSSARSGGSAWDISGYSSAEAAALYIPGTYTAGSAYTAPNGVTFTSLPDALLSAANGGTSTLYNVTKTAYPYLQSLNISGSAYTASNILEKLFDAFMETLTLGKGMPTTMLTSFTHFANCAKVLENDRRFSVTDKAAGYGWRKINVLGAEGEMEIVALRDKDSTNIPIVDWNSMKFHGSNFFDRKRHLDGNEFFLVRNVTGYDYIVDIRFFGDLVINKPSHNGIVYGISY